MASLQRYALKHDAISILEIYHAVYILGVHELHQIVFIFFHYMSVKKPVLLVSQSFGLVS